MTLKWKDAIKKSEKKGYNHLFSYPIGEKSFLEYIKCGCIQQINSLDNVFLVRLYSILWKTQDLIQKKLKI